MVHWLKIKNGENNLSPPQEHLQSKGPQDLEAEVPISNAKGSRCLC